MADSLQPAIAESLADAVQYAGTLNGLKTAIWQRDPQFGRSITRHIEGDGNIQQSTLLLWLRGVGLKEASPDFVEHMFDIVTVSREIEEVDMLEYLRPVDFGADAAQEVFKSFPAITQMRTEDVFKTIFNVELLFYRNVQKTRSQILALTRGPDNACRLLDEVFDKIMEVSGREQLVSLTRLNAYLAKNSGRQVVLSPEGFAMVALVLNDCNPTKPRKITRSAFVNFYLGRDFQMPIDVSAIAHLVDHSRIADHSVDDLFKQIRGEIKTDDLFQRSFNVDPKITAGIAGFAQNMFGRAPALPFANNQAGDSQRPSENFGGIMGFMGDPKVQHIQNTQNISNQYSHRTPSQPITATFDRPPHAENSVYNKQGFDYDEIRDRPPRNQGFDAKSFLKSNVEASATSSKQERPWNAEKDGPKRKESPPANPVRYYGSQLADVNESRPPYVPLPSSHRFEDNLDQSRPQSDFLGNRSVNPAALGHNTKQLKALDESSFLNYQEIKPSEDFAYQAEEIKAKMDPNVRNNLKRFEYDF
jgi:hypothetical protein